MAVEVQFAGRLGNNLFQYAIGRIIAEHLGYELVCVPAPEYRHGSAVVLAGGRTALTNTSEFFPDAPLHLPGKSFTEPQERYIWDDTGWNGQTLPLQQILGDRRDRRIVLKGFFQRMEYYWPWRDQVRRWLRPRGAYRGPAPDPDDVLVCIRRGLDYFSLGWAMDLGFYTSVLEKKGPGRVYVSGVGEDRRVKEALAPFDPIYLDGPPMERFELACLFNRIVLSNSTFDWWSGWLSDAEEIWYPRCTSFWGPGFGVDLEVPEPRYRYVENVPPEPWKPLRRTASVALAGRANGTVAVAAGARRIDMPAAAAPSVEWLAAREEPFAPVDLFAHRGPLERGEFISRVVQPLMEAGAMVSDDEDLPVWFEQNADPRP